MGMAIGGVCSVGLIIIGGLYVQYIILKLNCWFEEKFIIPKIIELNKHLENLKQLEKELDKDIEELRKELKGKTDA